jgi:hypothetical protein
MVISAATPRVERKKDATNVFRSSFFFLMATCSSASGVTWAEQLWLARQAGVDRWIDSVRSLNDSKVEAAARAGLAEFVITDVPKPIPVVERSTDTKEVNAEKLEARMRLRLGLTLVRFGYWGHDVTKITVGWGRSASPPSSSLSLSSSSLVPVSPLTLLNEQKS